MNTQSNVPMTRAEAEVFMHELDQGLQACCAALNAIDRKKWRDSEKAMAKVPFIKRHDAYRKLREKIGGVFHLGGY